MPRVIHPCRGTWQGPASVFSLSFSPSLIFFSLSSLSFPSLLFFSLSSFPFPFLLFPLPFSFFPLSFFPPLFSFFPLSAFPNAKRLPGACRQGSHRRHMGLVSIVGQSCREPLQRFYPLRLLKSLRPSTASKASKHLSVLFPPSLASRQASQQSNAGQIAKLFLLIVIYLFLLF